MMLNFKFKKSFYSEIVFFFTIAAIYCGAVEINNHLLFTWLEDRPFRYWIYFPAGLKLFLIMIFGLRAVWGIAFGIAISMLSMKLGINFLSATIIGLGSGFAVLGSVRIFSFLTKIYYPWQQLEFYHIPMIAISAAIINALVAYGIYRLIGLEDPFDWQEDILIDIVGRFIGAFLFIYLAIFLRKKLKT